MIIGSDPHQNLQKRLVGMNLAPVVVVRNTRNVVNQNKTNMKDQLLLIKVSRIIYFIGLMLYLTFFGLDYGEVIFSHLTGVIHGGSELSLSLTLLFKNFIRLLITYLAFSAVYHFIMLIIIGHWESDDY